MSTPVVKQFSADRAPVRARSAPPLLFSISRWMIDRDIRGGWRLWNFLKSSRQLDVVVRYGFDGPEGETPLYMPLFREESSMSKEEIIEYPKEMLECVMDHITRLALPYDFIDCGADSGIVTVAFMCAAARPQSIVAFEPNAQAFSYLERSLKEWSVPTTVLNKAVGETTSRAKLVAASDKDSAHACFIEYDPTGSIEVERLDSLTPHPGHTVVLKLDVEGAEHAALRGAENLLRNASAFVVIFEAHPRTSERSGIDPAETIRFINSIAPVDVEIALHRHIRVDMERPFFEQLAGVENKICDIVCASKSQNG